ncbi:MAG: tetratricopeptide repeat protein, partial [Planctomycetes bacterium]|nr:tetratricopeptide repeat protein [Planctomycetota bacterium]
MRPRASAPRRQWLLHPWACGILLSACASSAVVRKDDTPRTKEVAGQGDYAWEARSGWVRPTRGKWGPPAQVRAESREAFDAGAYADALEGLLFYKGQVPSDDPTLPETSFLIAECYYQLGNYEKAVETYRDVYGKGKPEGDILNRSFQRVHDIAMDYLHERAICSFLGFSYGCPGRGIELLVGEDGLITQYPNLPFADDAIHEIAVYYFRDEQYPEAVPVFERLVR